MLTGPSHAGKTTTGWEIARRVPAPVAMLAIDDIVARFDLSPEDPWEHGLPAAYDVAVASADALLRRGFLVLVESTFTYIPPDERPGQFQRGELLRLAATAAAADARCLVVRLVAPLRELERRRMVTGRITPEIVEGTWQQHHRAERLPSWPITIRTDGTSPAEAAELVIAAAAKDRPAEW
ncbi:MAG: ATP-binding protein [Actinomycetota bacterium]|nr:ATP-binding protein [Actinomycetota bacterium]